MGKMEIVHNEEPMEDLDITVNEERGELAVGLKVPTTVKVPSGYLADLRKFNDIYNDIYRQMEVCNKLYKYNEVVGNAVDVLVDFAVTPVRFEPTGSAELDDILSFWMENLNRDNSNTLPGLYPMTQELALEWFTSGNAFPYRKWDNIEVNGRQYKLPLNINLINPQSISIPDEPIAFGQEIIYLKYDATLINMLKSDGRSSPEAALLKAAIPRTILKALSDQSGLNSQGVRLNPKYVTHLKRRAKGYQPWGVPYLTRCFASVTLLEKLRELDESISTGLINLITIFKIGTEEHPASSSRLQKFASLLKNPTATKTLVWAHDVEMIQVGPEGKLLALNNKRKDAKEDLLISLGIPPVLMSLQSGGNEWVAILSLVERLTHWRNVISLWLQQTGNQIAEWNNFEQKTVVKWDRMNLTDEKAVKNLVLAFYDRGLISIKTALNESNYEIDNEIEHKKDERKIQKDFQPPQLPFSATSNQPKGRPDSTENVPKKPKTALKVTQTVDLKQQKKKAIPGKAEIEEEDEEIIDE